MSIAMAHNGRKIIRKNRVVGKARADAPEYVVVRVKRSLIEELHRKRREVRPDYYPPEPTHNSVVVNSLVDHLEHLYHKELSN